MTKKFEKVKASFLECRKLCPSYAESILKALSITLEINAALRPVISDTEEIDEIFRDTQIVKSRLNKLNKMFDAVGEALLAVTTLKEKQIWIKQFELWFVQRMDFHQSFMLYQTKWETVQRKEV